MIADLHCHFPMHLVHEELEPPQKVDIWHWMQDKAEQLVFDAAGVAFNDPGWSGDWRVDYDGLRAGGFGVVCSVLYWPVSEFLSHGPRPRPGSFASLRKQLLDVERNLEGHDEHVVVRRRADLDDPRMRIVHCVEGVMHLVPDLDRVDAHVAELAERGVFYLTLAHLPYRGVATNAPALPP